LNGPQDSYLDHYSEERPAKRLQDAQDLYEFNYSGKRHAVSLNEPNEFYHSHYPEERPAKRFNMGQDFSHSHHSKERLEESLYGPQDFTHARHPENQLATSGEEPHINDPRYTSEQPSRSSTGLQTWTLNKYDNYLRQMEELINEHKTRQVSDPTSAMASLHAGLQKISQYLDAEPKLDLKQIRAQISQEVKTK
jgi:hypothetical protein